MKKYFLFFVITIVSMFYYSCSQVVENKFGLDHLKDLYNHLDDYNYVDSTLLSLDFSEKFNSIYVSNEIVKVNEPLHWIHITNMGKYSSVSISTADEVLWSKLKSELNEITTPESFDDGTSDLTYKYIVGKYKFETFEPINGINLSLNSLYQIFISSSE